MQAQLTRPYPDPLPFDWLLWAIVIGVCVGFGVFLWTITGTREWLQDLKDRFRKPKTGS